MELKSYERAKESLEFLIKANDSQLVSMAKNSTFLGLTRKMFFEATLEIYHVEWSKAEVRILWWIVERVLDIAFDIYLFREHPIDLFRYIEGRLRWHPLEFREDLIKMLNYCINDAKRFPKSKVNIEYIKQQLKDLKSSELSEGIILDPKQSFSFFGVEEISMDEFVDAFIYSWGYAMTEKEEIDRLMKRYVELTGGNILPPQPINSEKYKAKHYVLAYLFECHAKGEIYPIGNKRELERIGNERMGTGKGNRFYKVFNEIINKDLNAENNLFEIGGEYWRKAVIELSKVPELVEKYLQSKQL